jgi:hypothetical protein
MSKTKNRTFGSNQRTGLSGQKKRTFGSKPKNRTFGSKNKEQEIWFWIGWKRKIYRLIFQSVLIYLY